LFPLLLLLLGAGLSLAAVSFLLLTVILMLELQNKLVLTARCAAGWRCIPCKYFVQACVGDT
jgi:hypothetical protein